MAKDKEAIPGIIPQNEYKEHLEKEVAYYKSIAVAPQYIAKKRYTADKVPTKFKDVGEEREYQVQCIERLINGYDGLSGKGWGFLNFAKIRDPERGKISPDFRACQEAFYQKLADLEKNPGRGIVGYKRRRLGYSTLAAWDAEHSCITRPFYQIGMNSKSENDSRNLFKHIKFIHQNLPDWLRPRATASDRRDFMEFAYYDKDAHGNRIKKGLQSWIYSVAPTPEAHEGNALSKLIVDEAGKHDVLSIWQYAEDCLKLNTRRVGIPLIMGTLAEVDKLGRGLMEMILNCDAYSLDKFCFYGYNGLIMDDFGNDLVEEAIRFIIYERERLKKGAKSVYLAFLQKYPLCDKDAFLMVSTGGVGNLATINDQIVKLTYNPPEKRTGWMRPKPDGGVDFVPNPEGKIIVYDLPDQGRSNGYVAGCDPSDHDDTKKNKDSSNLALAVVAKPFGAAPPKLILEYVDRPEKLDLFFEQSAMVLKWYNNTKVLIEDNRARMINYFKANYAHLLPLVPKSFTTARGGVEMKNSIRMTQERKEHLKGTIEDNVDRYCEFIPSIRLLEEFKVLGDDHADDDLAMAYGIALIFMQSDKKAAVASESNKVITTHLEWVGGHIQRVSQGTPVIPARIVPRNHPLFK